MAFMPRFDRRSLLKTSALAGIGLLAASPAGARRLPRDFNRSSGEQKPSPRERLLLDAGWRFHFGHASDPKRDFDFGEEQNTYAKAGANSGAATALSFDDRD